MASHYAAPHRKRTAEISELRMASHSERRMSFVAQGPGVPFRQWAEEGNCSMGI